jgi:hypothetical protein
MTTRSVSWVPAMREAVAGLPCVQDDERLAEGRQENWCHRRPRDGMGKTVLGHVHVARHAHRHLHAQNADQPRLVPGIFGLEWFCSADFLTKRLSPSVSLGLSGPLSSQDGPRRDKDILSRRRLWCRGTTAAGFCLSASSKSSADTHHLGRKPRPSGCVGDSRYLTAMI